MTETSDAGRNRPERSSELGRSGRPRRPGRPGRPIAVGAAVALVVLALTAAAYVVLVVVPAKTVETGEAAGRGAIGVAAEGARTAMDLASELADRLKDELGLKPRVRVDSHLVSEQSTEILELATVERTYRIDYVFAHTWLGSTKEIRLQGRYLAKAGFDLEDHDFVLDLETVDVAPERGPQLPFRLELTLPEPELLSLELLNVGIEEEEGIWNRIADADRERALAGLRRTARREVLATGILDEAEEAMASRVRKAFLEQFAPTELRFGPVEVPEISPAPPE
jgi:hypothetical protein